MDFKKVKKHIVKDFHCDPQKNPVCWYIVIFLGLVLSLLIVFSSFGQLRARQPAIYFSEPGSQTVQSVKPFVITVGNITGDQLAVGFVTGLPTYGTVYLFEDNRVVNRFVDDRGEETVSQNHLITLKDLKPDAFYQIKLCIKQYCEPRQADGWYGVRPGTTIAVNSSEITVDKIIANGDPFTIKTGQPLDHSARPQINMSGQVLNKPFDGLVSITARNDSQETSSNVVGLVNSDTGWTADLGLTRNQTWNKFFNITDYSVLTIDIILVDGTVGSQDFQYLDIKGRPLKVEF